MSTTTTLDPVAAAVEAAKAAAAAAIANQAAQAGAMNLPAVQQAPAYGVPAVPQAAGKPFTMDDVGGSSIVVDSWVGVNEHGLTFGKNKALFTDPVEVEITLSEVAPHRSIKAGKNPARYWKTYDGVTAASGGSWAAAMHQAQLAEPGARDYPSADIPMTLLQDVVVKGQKVASVDERIGYTLSTTNWKNWKRFWDLCAGKGLTGGTVKARISSEQRTGGGNTWGVMLFELVEG